MLLDYHVHAVAHGEYKYDYEWLRLFLEKACQLGIKEIGFTEHDEFVQLIDRAMLYRLSDEYGDVSIRLGLEVDFIPGRELEIAALRKKYDWDYFIGSIHFIDGWGFDHPDYRHLFAAKDCDQVYEEYFALVNQMVLSGLFDVVGHIDLIKIWGHRPERKSVIDYASPVLQNVKAAGMAIEINSAGLRKPVREIYPAQELLETMFAMDIPVTLGTDAHHPDQLGEGLPEAVRAAWQAGYRQVVALTGRRHRLVSLE